MSAFIDNLVEGKQNLLDLKDVAKTVAKDILNTWTRLALLNPLKNMLFGTNDQTMGGTAGTGGFLGCLFGSITGGGQTMANPYNTMPMFAKGGIMSSQGSMPLRRYASGGIARSPQLAMFGEGSRPEAYVPLPDGCLLYTSPSPRDRTRSRMPSSA